MAKVAERAFWRPRIGTLICIFAALVIGGCAQEDGPGPSAFADQLVAAFATNTLETIPKTPDTRTVDAPVQAAEVLAPLEAQTGVTAPPVQVLSVTEPSDRNNVGSQAVATLGWDWDFGDDEVWSYTTAANLEVIGDTGGGNPGWAVHWDPSILLPDLAPGERLSIRREVPPRAGILDGQGDPLVMPRPVWRIGIDKTLVPAEQWDASARELVDKLATLNFNFNADDYAARVNAAGERAFVEIIVLRQADWPDIRPEIEHIPGARALSEMRDLAPSASFARALLGTAGEATAELIEGSGGRIQRGDTTGLSGLQRFFDEQLSGRPGLVVNVTDASGNTTREAFRIDTELGLPLQTTLDPGAQAKAEEILAQVEPAAAIVAIRPSTGEVLVAANSPGSGAFNTALLGQYAPGSTFKVIDALALDRHGVTADSLVQCPETIVVDGRTFQNVPGYPESALGDVPLRTAFAHSCNTAFIGQKDTVSQADLAAASSDLGLGVDSPLGVGAFFGSVPEQASGTEHAANMLGQGTILASPFAMARVAASVAAGQRVDPILVIPANPREFPQLPPSALTESEAGYVLDLMRSVVTDGSATMLADIPGIIGAKTGTAQFGDGTQSHTWMIAMADLPNGLDVAVAVFVEVGQFGSTTSGPLMHEFLQYLATR